MASDGPSAALRLVPITREGAPASPVGVLPEMVKEILQHTAELYSVSDYAAPWLGYLVLEGEQCVGFCAFKSTPKNGAVEIAYATAPDCEGRGLATRMAKTLVDMARGEDKAITVRAQTLPEENASTSILKKLRFEKIGTVDHPDDGPVWEWRLAPEA